MGGVSWGNDQLGRKEESEFLTKYLIGKYEDSFITVGGESFVLNIDAEWGFGKTYFLREWEKDLRALNPGHPVVYYNAWENDFSKDPLISFISEINTELKPYFNDNAGARKLLSMTVNSAKKLWRPALPIILAALSKKITGLSLDQINEYLESDEIELDDILPEDGFSQPGDSSDDEAKGQRKTEKIETTVSSVISQAATAALKEHNSIKKSTKEFKKNLAKLIDEIADREDKLTLPMFIFVDELDRCRPDYAIELLETIKHLFGVRGVYFVVATASKQLGHSIKAVYGEGFDSEQYLKRFFNQTYSFLKPDNRPFANFIFDRYKLKEKQNIFSPISSKEEDGDAGAELFARYSTWFVLDLRSQIQVVERLHSIVVTRNHDEIIHLGFLLFLLMLKQANSDLFEKFRIFLNEPYFEDKALKFFESDAFVTRIKGDSTFSESLYQFRSHQNNESTYSLSDIVGIYFMLAALNQESFSEKINRLSNESNYQKKIQSVLINESNKIHNYRIDLILKSYFDSVLQVNQFHITQ
ncbi:P-loop NTPase fold protein [Desulfoluna sp.]|uniref:KAP family P-loop NTPase fold protein n=1 Tax=Desulfoluna sp. TaxID=2045199 RepID=UPI00262683E1|nr:P-loop NTPase fold protein [Desulfoluna sp.]